MSRIGKNPINVPDKVKVGIKDKSVLIEGPLGKMSYTVPEGIAVDYKDGKIFVSRENKPDSKDNAAAIHGTSRARLANIVQGITAGFTKILEIQGVGFRGQVEGRKLSLQVGFSHPAIIDIPEGIKMSLDPKQTILTITGIDKDVVGDIAARIKRIKPPEPYKGTGIRYQGEHIARKAGKTAAGASGGTGAGAGGAKK